MQHDGSAGKLSSGGFTYIDVEKTGEYKIILRRWPKELDHRITQKAPQFVIDRKKHDQGFKFYQYKNKTVAATKAGLKIGSVGKLQKIGLNDNEVTFIVNLPCW